MKLKCDFVINNVAGETVAVSVGNNDSFNGYIKLNETGAFIWDLLKEETTVEAIAKALVEKYEIDIETATRDTEAYICMLKEANALA